MRNITELQKRLIFLGYPVGPNGADGKFGQNTLDAFNRFRASKGMGPVVQSSMAELNALLFPEEQPPPPKPNVIQDWLLGLAIKQAVSKLFPGKENLPMDNILVAVKSAWLSKLNWTLAAGAVFNVLAFFGIGVPVDVKDTVVVVGNGVVLIAAWIIRTWFTTAITTASAKSL